MFSFLLLAVGLVFLVKGADLMVDGAAAIARRFQVPDIVIGLTVVAFGTSLPELFVNIYASLSGSSGIAVGNVLGSNIANVLLILGVAGLILPLKVERGTVWAEIPLSVLAALMLGVAANDILLDGATTNALTRTDGLAFLGFFLIFFAYTYSISKGQGEMEAHVPENDVPMGRALIMVVGGMAGLGFGGDWIVKGAVEIAGRLGMSDDVVGLTIVAIGTSLPELATSVAAALRGNAAIAVGNVVGSNLFNIFFVLGISATIKPLPFRMENNLDIGFGILASVLLFIFMFTGKRRVVDRVEAALMLALYVGYMVLVLFRNGAV